MAFFLLYGLHSLVRRFCHKTTILYPHLVVAVIYQAHVVRPTHSVIDRYFIFFYSNIVIDLDLVFYWLHY